MAKVWTRIVLALIFVFATISSPFHARAHVQAHIQTVSVDQPVAAHGAMPGMSDDCAKAMSAAAQKAKPAQKAPDHSGGCCANGCNCPLSHCPATLAVIGSDIVALPPVSTSARTEMSDLALASNPSGKLKRPPRL